jgi:hypothetical protein
MTRNVQDWRHQREGHRPQEEGGAAIEAEAPRRMEPDIGRLRFEKRWRQTRISSKRWWSCLYFKKKK